MTRDITGTVGITAHDQSDSPNAQNRMKLRRSHAVQKDSSTQDMTYHASSPQTAKAISVGMMHRHTRRDASMPQRKANQPPPHQHMTRPGTRRQHGNRRDEQDAFVMNRAHSSRTERIRHERQAEGMMMAPPCGMARMRITSQRKGHADRQEGMTQRMTARHAIQRTRQRKPPCRMGRKLATGNGTSHIKETVGMRHATPATTPHGRQSMTRTQDTMGTRRKPRQDTSDLLRVLLPLRA